MEKVVFLDRDGVINRDKGYVHRWADFEFIPGAIEAMHQLSSRGFKLVVVTNQSGIARGYFTENDYFSLRNNINKFLMENDVNVLATYHCPHHPNGTVPKYALSCNCRKPLPGMLLAAARDYSINLDSSLLIGDKPSDIKAAKAAGVGVTFMINSDNPESNSEEGYSDYVFENLLECSKFIIANFLK